MDDEDKPFVCTRHGASFNIMPRNAAGWWYLALWTLPALASAGGYAWIMDPNGGGTGDTIVTTAVFIVLLALWAGAMTRWMHVRSEVIDLRQIQRDRPTKGGRRRS